MKNKDVKYSTGFTAGALLFKETEAIVSNITNATDYINGDEVIDYKIIKFLLICGYIGLVAVAIFFAVKNRKDRLEDKLQDDSH